MDHSIQTKGIEFHSMLLTYQRMQYQTNHSKRQKTTMTTRQQLSNKHLNSSSRDVVVVIIGKSFLIIKKLSIHLVKVTMKKMKGFY
jgi:hypothetical protein